MKATKSQQQYNSKQIISLKGLEPVRKRPGMYIGTTDQSGLHHLIWEILDNSLDEAIAGYASEISITLTKQQTIVVKDNGRGIPIDQHQSGKSGVELVFSELHAGGKFTNQSYQVAAGLHGVGASVVNALSQFVTITVDRNNCRYVTKFTNSKLVQPTTLVQSFKSAHPSGTSVEFMIDFSFFKINDNEKFRQAQFNDLDHNLICDRLQTNAYLLKNVRFNFTNEQTGLQTSYCYPDGIDQYLNQLSGQQQVVKPFRFYAPLNSLTTPDANQCALTMIFSVSDQAGTIASFVNYVKTTQGGTHESGFVQVLTKTVNEFAKKQGWIKSKGDQFQSEDILANCQAIINLSLVENLLHFESQTKTKLASPIAMQIFKTDVGPAIDKWLKGDLTQAKAWIKLIQVAKSNRLAAAAFKAQHQSLKKIQQKTKLLSAKLAAAKTNDPSKRELFLVEGDSAGGSAKLGRDSKIQAILPLRGKVLNSYKAKLIDIFHNEELATIVNVCNAGIGKDFDLKKLAYHKIIIMADADADGAHIQVLLLTFFLTYMRPLVAAGMLYIATPPLYKLTYQNQDHYFWNQAELDHFIKNHKISHKVIQRYKGLGEMNAHQLWQTTMDPSKRHLIKVKLEDEASTLKQFALLMGDDSLARQQWINTNVDFNN